MGEEEEGAELFLSVGPTSATEQEGRGPPATTTRTDWDPPALGVYFALA